MSARRFFSTSLAVVLTQVGFAQNAKEFKAPFEPVTIDDKIKVGYGLALSDVDGDGKTDILLVDAGETVWYHNPTWKKYRLTGALTRRDHVCLCAKDLDGDSKAEVVVGAEWNPGDTENSGAVFALESPPDCFEPWSSKKLHHEPTVHRMGWVKEKGNRHFLAVLPLHGRGNKNGEGTGIKFLGYRPAEDWSTFLIHQGFHLAHNFDAVNWDDKDSESILVACKEGVHLLQPEAESWSAKQITADGAGEVRLGKLPDGSRFVATIEPMHGNKVVINSEKKDGLWSMDRQVIDDSLNQGHAVVVGDFLKLGYDQVIAGWRNGAGPEKKVGLKLYRLKKDGKGWESTAVGGSVKMACEDAKAADLDGDGKLDLVAAGRSTKNVVIYWNRQK